MSSCTRSATHTALFLLLGLICFDLDADQPYDPALITKLAETAMREGNPARGAVIYSAPTSACFSCHKVGQRGGDVGPDLSQVGAKQKLDHIIESLLWPKRVIAEPYKAIAVLTADGRVIRGYRTRESDSEIEIRDSADGKSIVLADDDIEDVREVGTLMPEGLLATMSVQDKRDLIAFLADLGKHEKLSPEAIDTLLAHSHSHHPAPFQPDRRPLDPDAWPSWQAQVNRDRIYDFYAKQARHFRQLVPRRDAVG